MAWGKEQEAKGKELGARSRGLVKEQKIVASKQIRIKSHV
jgi:hypothetical protein